LEDKVETGVAEIRDAGKRRPSQKLDLSDPRVITKEIVVAMAKKVSPDDIAGKVHQLINAKRDTKHGLIPDVRSMEAGIKLYLAYVVGLPVQRSEVLTVNLDADSTTGFVERLKNSPAMRESLRRALEAAEEGAPSPPPLEAETVSK
jgi:hypothetical protein